MNLVVNVDLDWGIGRSGGLLVNLAADMRHFKQLTTGKTIILGRKTLATFPQGRPLPARTNLILSKDQGFSLPDALVCHSLTDLAEYIKAHPAAELMVVGGELVYRQLLPYCRLAYVTKVQARLGADRFLANLDKETGWHLLEEGPWQSGLSRGKNQLGELNFKFCLYQQDEPKAKVELGRTKEKYV